MKHDRYNEIVTALDEFLYRQQHHQLAIMAKIELSGLVDRAVEARRKLLNLIMEAIHENDRSDS
jgi:hypothetical protein